MARFPRCLWSTSFLLLHGLLIDACIFLSLFLSVGSLVVGRNIRQIERALPKTKDPGRRIMMRLFAGVLLGFSTLAVHAENKRLFAATLLKPPGSPLPNVFGAATVFLASDDRLACAGWGQSFPPLLDGGNCTAANSKCRKQERCRIFISNLVSDHDNHRPTHAACGVAIHSGTCTAVGASFMSLASMFVNSCQWCDWKTELARKLADALLWIAIILRLRSLP